MNRINRLWKLHCEIKRITKLNIRVASSKCIRHLKDRKAVAITEYNKLKFWFLLSK